MNRVTHQARLHALKKQLFSNDLDAAIISHKENILYLTGLAPLHPTEREAFLLLTPTKTVLYHSLFIKPPTTNPKLRCIPMSTPHPFQRVITSYLGNPATVGIEKENLSLSESERLQTILPNATFNAIDTIPATLRQIKDAYEISQIKKAIQITTKTLKWAQIVSTSTAAQNITEIELCRRIENQMIVYGADDLAFPTIVAFNAHTAFPHHQPTNSRLTPNSIILVDCGAKVKGYCADMTRTWCIGKPTPLFSQIETVVKTASAIGQALLGDTRKSPLLAQDIDKAVRQVVSKAGYGPDFIHSTGHGLGLEAHELPTISTGSNTPIQPNMVITIEPGIYLPRHFGYRHEDTIIVTKI